MTDSRYVPTRQIQAAVKSRETAVAKNQASRPVPGHQGLDLRSVGDRHRQFREQAQPEPRSPSSVALSAAARTASSTRARKPLSSSTCIAAAVVPPGEVTS